MIAAGAGPEGGLALMWAKAGLSGAMGLVSWWGLGRAVEDRV